MKIYCGADLGHGVDATVAGFMYITDVDIETHGAHGAALSTDTGGGTVVAIRGTMSTAGDGSPGIMSTGNITVINATITAGATEGGAIDGSNSITIYNTHLTGYGHGFKLFNSISGGTSGSGTVTVVGGEVTTNSGDCFYMSGSVVKSTIVVQDGAVLSPSNGCLLLAESGATATFTAKRVTLTGTLISSSSTVTATLQSSTKLTGSTTAVSLVVSSDSTWKVNAASTVTTLTSTGTIHLTSVTSTITASGAITLSGSLLVDVGSSAVGSYQLISSSSSLSGTFSTLTLDTTQVLGSLQYSSTAVTLVLTENTVSSSSLLVSSSENAVSSSSLPLSSSFSSQALSVSSSYAG